MPSNFAPDEFFDWCESEEIDPSSVRLVLCQPVAMPTLDGEFFEEVYPEDCGVEVLPKAITDAMDAFNAAVREADPISWEATNIRVDMAELEATCKTN
jgi:hypothetical protein